MCKASCNARIHLRQKMTQSINGKKWLRFRPKDPVYFKDTHLCHAASQYLG
jgi:hypothetical protein